MKTNEQIACNNWEKIGYLKGKQSAEKGEVWFLENEIWHLKNQPEEYDFRCWEKQKKIYEQIKLEEMDIKIGTRFLRKPLEEIIVVSQLTDRVEGGKVKNGR